MKHWGLLKALVVLSVTDALYLGTYGDNFSKMMKKFKETDLKIPL